MRRRQNRVVSLVAASVLTVSCGGGRARHIPDGGDGGSSDGDVEPLPPTDVVDILFLLDTSCAGEAMQAELGRAGEVLFRELMEPTEDPATGRTASPVRDLHVGITTMAADTAGFAFVGCDEPELGGLVFEQRDWCPTTLPAEDCDAPPCPWLRALGGVPREPPISEDAACLFQFGACGCGWEQPLEAARLALTAQSEPGARNHGFVREGSVLAVVVMNNGDDCSVADPTLFDLEAIEDHITTRCHLHQDMLRPVEASVELLLRLRPGREDRIVVGVLGGFPIDGTWNPGDPVEALREMIHVDPLDPQSLAPCCGSIGGCAAPAPRLAELAYAFGDGGFIASICQEDWSEAMMGLARTIQRRLE